MQQRTLLVVLAFALALSVSARVLEDVQSTPVIARQLQQVIDTSNARCPDGCASGFCQADATTAGLRCVKCSGSLVVKTVNGKCSCPRGKFSDGSTSYTCSDCPKGSYCAGADFVLGVNGTGKEDCPNGMTTLGRRTESARGCVNLPGYSYSISADGSTIDQVICPLNTYSAGLKKQRACVPCPTGYITLGVQSDSPTDCVVPPGYYLKGPGQVAPCPKGEYKELYGPAGNCSKCAFGVTTEFEASISVNNCTMVVPGRYPVVVDADRVVTQTEICPQKYYCPGGTPFQGYNAAAGELADAGALVNPGLLNSTLEATIKLCETGLWTQDLGSTSRDQCLTPPGFKTSGVDTVQCADGEYRADWKPANLATNCLSCGTGVFADKTDRVKVFDIADPTNVTYLAVTTSADDCYILAGHGLYYSTITGAWRARACDTNNYGVANRTYGLTPQACKDCPTGMVTSTDTILYPNSSAYFYTNPEDGSAGFISALACVTEDGWGYNGRVAQQCDVGSYNSKDTRSTCTKCGYGLTTSAVGAGVTEADCGLAAGFGNNTATLAIAPCAIGTYNDVPWTLDRTTNCTACTTGLTTEKEGSDSSEQCNMCVAGYGGTDCATQCGGGVGTGATYGPVGRGSDNSTNACITCSSAGTGFSFEYNLTNMVYAPVAVSRLGANFSGDCLTQFTQIVDGAWYIPVADTSPAWTAADAGHTNETSLEACLARCDTDVAAPGTPVCMFVNYNYDTGKCMVFTEDTTLVGSGDPAIAWKAGPSGDTAASAFSKRKNAKGKSVSSGMYSWFHDVNGADFGTQTLSSATTIQDCLDACDDDTTCAGISYVMGTPNVCNLIKGDSTLGVFTRTMLATQISRISKTSIEDPASIPPYILV